MDELVELDSRRKEGLVMVSTMLTTYPSPLEVAGLGGLPSHSPRPKVC